LGRVEGIRGSGFGAFGLKYKSAEGRRKSAVAFQAEFSQAVSSAQTLNFPGATHRGPRRAPAWRGRPPRGGSQTGGGPR